MRVVVIAEPGPARGASQAPDGSLLGRGVAGGWAEQAPHDDVETYLVCDGRAGFTDALGAIAERTEPVLIAAPTGEQLPAQIVLAGGTAYVEVAEVVGAHRDLTGVAPSIADSSAAVGELMLAARATGADRIVVGVGNDVSCHDGGAGLLAALGAGTDLAGLPQVICEWSTVTLVLATASLGALTGFNGASASLQSERGVDAATAQAYEARIGAFVDSVDAVLRTSADDRLDLLTGAPVRRERTPGAGVGGGIGYALQLLGASTIPGAAFVLSELSVTDRLPGALIVLVTGRYDWHSVAGGVVAAAAAAALEVAAPAVLLADEVMVGRREGMSLGIGSTYARRPGERPEQFGARVARTWSPPPR
ncbi:MAG: glycerate kinase [Ornithinimicrobium sp.]